MKKNNILLLSFLFSYFSMHAMHNMPRVIDNLHESNQPKLSKLDYICQRQNKNRKIARDQQITAKEKVIQRNKERKNNPRSEHFTANNRTK